MTVLLALLSALFWGVGDFCGGLATRRATLLTAMLGSQGLGLCGLAVAAVIAQGTVTPRDLLAGAGGGLLGGLGLACLYRALAMGSMALVAPLTGVVAALLPAVAGLALGERPSAPSLLGIALAVLAVALISSVPQREAARTPQAAVLLSLLAGTCFAGFYVALSRASGEAGLWPLVAARSAATAASALTAGLLLLRGRSVLRLPRGGTAALVLLSGLLDVTANVLYVVAVHRGLLSVVAVLVSLYPAGTVLCAMLVLQERLRRLQVAGLLAAAAGVALISG